MAVVLVVIVVVMYVVLAVWVFRCSGAVESLLTNRAGVASPCFALLIGMISDVMLLEVLSSVKASVAHSTREAAILKMNGLSVPLQHFLSSERLGANVAHWRLSVFLGR